MLGNGDLEIFVTSFLPKPSQVPKRCPQISREKGVVWGPTERMGALRPALCVGSSLSAGEGGWLCRSRCLPAPWEAGAPGQAGLWAGEGRRQEELTAPSPSRTPPWLCVLWPDTWSLHTGPCPGCLSSPCLGPNLCQAEADTRTGVTSVWLPVRKLAKEKLFP